MTIQSSRTMERLTDRERTAEPFWRSVTRRRLGTAGGALLTLLAVAPAAGAPPAARSPESTWVRVSYRELLDPGAITHSGAKLVDVLHLKASRGEVQPFLDPYSSLLGYAVQMISGADPVPQTSLAERYPPGAAQPAWAAVLRAGRYFVSSDGQGHARVFLPGDDPRAAYRRAYSVLRHPLAAALAPGSPLRVEVFTYRNDYAAAELRLNPVPHRFRAQSFPPQGQPLDLGELEAFFRQGGQLEGAELAPGGGLTLYASQARQQRLGGESVSLADLAVACRAVFHAGDAEAFVSLDRNADPTLASVNFGGLLEDTRIGQAVLAADVRFKTISSGLDSVTYDDVREKTRRVVPSFMSNSERRFLINSATDLGKWVAVRYWYYPDSCGVDSDDDDRLAAITQTQLTADVERLSEGSGAARKNKPALSAEYRENIRDLNKNYARYAEVFPEYRDLSSAARLMALAAWFGRVRPEWLDLDGLLAVSLPPESTPRVVPLLFSAQVLQLSGNATPSRDYVLRNTRVQHLTPELDKRVSESFGDPQRLAVFLAFKAGKGLAQVPDFDAEAGRIFAVVPEKRVRELVQTTGDAEAFLRSFAARFVGDRYGLQPGESARDSNRLAGIRSELAALPAAAAEKESVEDPRRRRLEAELGELLRKYHSQGRGAGSDSLVTTQYTGGVSLAPRLFSVNKSATRPALEKLKTASRTAGATWGAAGWIRSGDARAAAAASVSRAPATPAKPNASSAPPSARSPRPAAAKTKSQPPPPDDAPEPASLALPTATPALRSITVPKSATPAGAALVGRLGDDRRIVFTRAAR